LKQNLALVQAARGGGTLNADKPRLEGAAKSRKDISAQRLTDDEHHEADCKNEEGAARLGTSFALTCRLFRAGKARHSFSFFDQMFMTNFI